MGERTGFRNAQATALAPTGTIGLLMDCDTTGVEPDFALVKFKKLSGGGTVALANRSIGPGLERLGYEASVVAAILAHLEAGRCIEKAPGLRSEHLAIFDCANRAGPDSQRFLAPSAHLRMLAAVQPFVSGAISKTVNLPSDATVEQIAAVFTEAWRLRLKSVAVYRDGSKLSQPLNVGSAGGAGVQKAVSTALGADAEQAGDTPPCGFCGHRTVRNASCFRCLNCGQSIGCS
jgi:ribonucleoside-diphosphate reductase alpha chain